MDLRKTALDGSRYCQVFGTRFMFAAAYPITKKSECDDALKQFLADFGSPLCLIMDGSKEQTAARSAFYRRVLRNNIRAYLSGPYRPNQNPAETVIRELRKRWYRTVFRTNCPQKLWNYALPFIALLMSHTASNAASLGGRTPVDALTGDTPDISGLLDFAFYDRVWFKQNAGLSVPELGRFLDSRLYQVELADGQSVAVTANNIAMNIFSQMDSEGRRQLILSEITGIRTDGMELLPNEAFVISPNGVRRRKETTRGWEIQMLWKDGSTTWNKLRDVKKSFPIDIPVMHSVDHLPAFAWWVPYVLKKKGRIIAKVKSKYWSRTHKYGIRIPKAVEEALRIDKENGNTLWWDAIKLEMKNVRPAFEVHEGAVTDLEGYQKIRCHMIFDVKLGKNFRRKAGGHTTETPASLTYSTVVTRESVRVALTIAASNGLNILACDIQNAYLTAECRELIYTTTGPEFGSEAGKTMIVKMAMYGLKSSGAAFHSKLADTHAMQFRPSKADPDVWLWPAVKADGSKCYDMVLCYVDDVIAISQVPMDIIEEVKKTFKLKGDKATEPDVYLGAQIQKVQNSSGTDCWTNDTSPELDADDTQYFQELIGILRWAVELGRVGILSEVSILSSHLAMPREGHLKQAIHIFSYLKHRRYSCGSIASSRAVRFQETSIPRPGPPKDHKE